MESVQSVLSLQSLRRSVWRVPLITVIAGALYTPCCVQILLRYGVVSPGVIDGRVSLLTSGFLLAAVLLLGWVLLLRDQTRREIFLSASLVVAYGLVLFAVQLLTGSTTGPAAVVFLRLVEDPLSWTVFPAQLGLYMRERLGWTVPFLGLLRFFVPYLFVLFGKRDSRAVE